MKAIVNAKIIGRDDIINGKALLYEETIKAIIPEESLAEYSIEDVLDAGGKYLSPGFIDIHVHGCAGYDAMDGTEEAILSISKVLCSTGVTAFLATTMTEAFDKIEKALRNIKEHMGNHQLVQGAQILGSHLEGPFISEKNKGAQSAEHIMNPDFARIEAYQDVIKLVTMAPELKGSEPFIKACRENGIIVSIGHSDATYEEAKQAMQWGAGHITHTFNGMTPLHHRKPGIIGAAINSDASCELIVDNVHLHPAIPEIMLRAKGEDKVILITDAMRACLMEDGEFELGGQKVIVKDGAARLEQGNLAGSILTLNVALKNFTYNTGIDLAKSIKLLSLNPARVLGIDASKGSLEVAKDADMTIFDHNFDIYHTFVGGREVYRRLTK